MTCTYYVYACMCVKYTMNVSVCVCVRVCVHACVCMCLCVSNISSPYIRVTLIVRFISIEDILYVLINEKIH